jgi:hypothetical protein
LGAAVKQADKESKTLERAAVSDGMRRKSFALLTSSRCGSSISDLWHDLSVDEWCVVPVCVDKEIGKRTDCSLSLQEFARLVE